MEDALPSVVSGLQEAMDNKAEAQKRGGRPLKGMELLRPLNLHLQAGIGLQTVSEGARETLARSTIKSNLGDRLNTEWVAWQIEQIDPDFLEEKVAKAKKDHQTEAAQFLSVYHRALNADLDIKQFTQEEKHAAATWLYGFVMDTGIFDEWDDRRWVFDRERNTWRPHDTLRLTYHQDALAAIQDLDNTQSWWRSHFPSTPQPPASWADGDGPYISKQLNMQVPPVRRAGPAQVTAWDKAVNDNEMPEVIAGMDALGSTAMTINQGTADLVKHCWHHRGDRTIGKLLRREALPSEPLKPANDNDEVDQARYRREKRDLAKFNRRITSHSGAMKALYADIEWLCKHEFTDGSRVPIHNSVSLDTRTRNYPIPGLNHYYGDYRRAMFDFANKKPITDEGFNWLMIHTANCGDFDKISKRSYSDRIDWVSNNLDLIRAVATDAMNPTVFEKWTSAGDPFLFQRACAEVVAAVDYGSAEYPCGIPVNIDASNSGTQIFSALIRYAPDARLVNLLPGEAPEDIYSHIADICNQRLLVDANSDRECRDAARKWLDNGGIDRSIIKRPTLAYGYSARAYGMVDMILEDFMQDHTDAYYQDGVLHPYAMEGDSNGFRCAHYLGHMLMQVIQQNIHSATVGMRFLRGVARAFNRAGLHMQWRTPCNAPVFQNYYSTDSDDMLEIKSKLGSRTLNVKRQSDTIQRETVRTGPVDARESSNGVAANFIHSIDASIVFRTVANCKARGIDDFFVIHDSFEPPRQTCLTCSRGAQRLHRYLRAGRPVPAAARRSHRRRGEPKPPAALPVVNDEDTFDIRQVADVDYAFS